MIEYEFFPARCTPCPFKTDTDQHNSDLEDVKEERLNLSVQFVGDDNIGPSIEAGLGVTRADVVKFQQGLASGIDEIDHNIASAKEEAVRRAYNCNGVKIVEITDPDTGASFLFRRCESTAQPGGKGVWQCDSKKLFEKGGEFAYAMLNQSSPPVKLK